SVSLFIHMRQFSNSAHTRNCSDLLCEAYNMYEDDDPTRGGCLICVNMLFYACFEQLFSSILHGRIYRLLHLHWKLFSGAHGCCFSCLSLVLIYLYYYI